MPDSNKNLNNVSLMEKIHYLSAKVAVLQVRHAAT